MEATVQTQGTNGAATGLAPRPQGGTGVQRQTIKDLMTFMQSPAAISSLQAACSKHLTPDRLLRVAGAAISRQPKLLECTRESLFVSISNCGQLGLEPNLLGEAYLVPFRNRKTGKVECQYMSGYRGLVKLARRSGEISTVEAHVVHEKDTFSYTYGDNPKIEHVPYAGDDDPGRVTHAYAVCLFKDGSKQRDVMTRREIEAIRSRSMAKDDGPWVTDYEEMCKKTVVRRLCKMLPLTIELADALTNDLDVDLGNLKTLDAVTGLETTDAGVGELPEPKVRRETAASRIGKKAAEAAGSVPPPAAEPPAGTPFEETPPAGVVLSEAVSQRFLLALAGVKLPLPISENYLRAMGLIQKDAGFRTLAVHHAEAIIADPARFAQAVKEWADAGLA